MDKFEKITTGLGEECGVFGAYDMSGGDVAPTIYYGLFCVAAQRTGELWYRGNGYKWRTEGTLQEGIGACE